MKRIPAQRDLFHFKQVSVVRPQPVPLCGFVQDYENEAERFRSVLDLEDGLVSQTYKRSRLESPALRVKGEVKPCFSPRLDQNNNFNSTTFNKTSFRDLIITENSKQNLVFYYIPSLIAILNLLFCNVLNRKQPSRPNSQRSML